MEDRRKIVVPIGQEPETPHFDAEETLLSARPVVPIAPAAATEGFNGARALPRTPFYRRSAFLAFVVIAAVGIGLAAGLSIARYRYQPEDASTAVAQPAQVPSASDRRTATVQPPKDQQSQATTLPEVKIDEKTTVNDTGTEDNEKTDRPEPTTRVLTKAPESSKEKSSNDKDDNVKTTKPEPRDKKRTSDDEESDTGAPRAQRRERRVRNRDENTVDIPRRIERAGEQINRIREIFEGSQQRP
ncbi:MAG TPA: hypothetical protein VGO69_03435 [Pyrinomonadaceae bacterium]|jgi:hypothetical protein|nr:hypothetical protein [Pyrinomonadaceae bacterium]